MKKRIIIFFLLLIGFALLGCTKKEEKVTQQTVREVTNSENSEKTDKVTESNEPEKIDETEKILADYGRILSGSWAVHPENADYTWELSWGEVPFVSTNKYILIDFVAEKPLFITGPRDSVYKKPPTELYGILAEVKKIEIESIGIFRIYYDKQMSESVYHRNLAFRYDSENDTISHLDSGHDPFIRPKILKRVSERLPE